MVFKSIHVYMYVKKVTKTYNRSTLAGKPDEMFVIEISGCVPESSFNKL